MRTQISTGGTRSRFRYQRVERSLRQAIEKGRYAPGQRLPDERQMAREFRVCRVTLRQAFDQLSQSRLIERIQGRGTFVTGGLQRAGYLCVLAVGPTVRFSWYVATVLSQAESVARQHGLQLSVRYLCRAEEVRDALAQIDADQTVAAGILVGDDLRGEIRPWVAAARLPWVVVGDFAEESRGPVVIDQVVGDNYRLAEAAARVLVQRGVQRAALLVRGESWVWSREKISAFRTVLDAAGVEAQRQQVCDLYAEAPAAGSGVSAHRQAVVAAILAVLDGWQRSNEWPQGILMSGTLLEVWRQGLAMRPEAERQLERAHVVALDFEEYRAMIPLAVVPPRLTWVLLSMAALMEQAVTRLLERNHTAHQPVRDYLRQVTVVDDGEATPPGPAPLAARVGSSVDEERSPIPSA